MVGNSELAYRMLARKYGADFCFTEMVNCEIFLKTKQNPISNMWYTTNELDRPLIIQICGHDELKMLQTSLILQNYCDAIDINLGCPQEIARKGYYEKAGAKMITVHGRTREQRGINTGFASWEHIKQIKLNVNIPVIANGGIIYSRHIDECIDYTNCDGIMVAETHLYNPLIFSTIKKSSLEIYEEFLVLHGKYKNKYDLKNIKSHSYKMLQVILKNKPELREELNKCKDLESFLIFINF
ncbi:trna-dihydrouridine synthase 1-like protein [Vairimorpha apis BRL 01]|uniref:Trna-dihydrouridine synthase 1-like protein n=1 Tax=Vairimorpha apis BRL 01 TaxID=1037528 RepID=T0L8E6_9MICR|nr:trna-dihydrouridine synthase 1-like protein [Vairimorpha apis BRL 01]